MSDQTHQRRTLDGYQVPVLRPDPPPPRNPNLLKAMKTAGHAGAGNQSQSSAAGGGASGVGVGASSGNTGARTRPLGRFDASRRPQPIRSASTLSGPLAFPPPIPRRDLMRLQKQAKQAERSSKQKIASSSARQLRADVGQTLHGMFPPAATIQRRVNNQLSTPHRSTITAPSSPIALKSPSSYKPLRQVMEEERISDIMKRAKQANVVRPQRIGPRSTASTPRAIPPHSSLPIAYIDERRRVRIVGEDSDAMDVDEDEDEEEGIQTQVGKKSVPHPVKRLAARKRDMIPASDSSSESDSSSDSSSKSVSSGPTLEYVSEPEDRRPAAEASDDDDIYATEEEVIPDVIILEDPRQAPPSTLVGSAEPPPEMIAALAALVRPTLEMQRTRRLPFNLRYLRVGFLTLCRELRVPSYSSGRRVSLSIHYMYKDGALYQATVDSWQCPLCSLMGVMPTRQMLECHLRWDHPELFYEWRKLLETPDDESWEVQIVIPEPVEPVEVPPTFVHRSSRIPRVEQVEPQTQVTPSKNETIAKDVPKSPIRARPTPSSTSATVTPSLRGSTVTLPDPADDDIKPRILNEPIPRPRDARSVTASGQSATATATASRPSPRSTTASTVQPQARRPPSTPSGPLRVVPPPADDPLGPAARPPYLPAESDYGGPTVYYSCRPGGACLFDLLGTLPMEPYGLLDWEVIDREEEIYESDDVQDEYKVMQALWSRWIMLNRNLFVSNYYKGIIAFVDQYWKFIHKAAGWAALRYWLVILLANDFLTTHEVSKTLIYYEGLTGMSQWYTP